MAKFYLSLWLYWLLRVVTCSVVLAFFLASFITVFLYIQRGMPSLQPEVMQALWEILKFWFAISLNLTLLVALFRSTKYIFNRCFDGYNLKMLACPKEQRYIEEIGYGDLIKFWRRWLMLLIWLSGAMMVISFVLSKMFFGSEGSIFTWFSIYMLYVYIAIAGYISFVLITTRCKLVKVVRC